MSIRIVPRGVSLIEETASELIRDGLDYSANLVVFPGKRPAHFLRKTLADRVKGSIVPPCILSMDEFIDRLYETVSSDRRIEPMDAIAILYDIHRDSPKPLGKDGFLTPESFFPLGLKIYHDIEELSIECVSVAAFKGVEGLAGENIPVHSAKRLQSLSHFYEKFYQRVQELGCSTRSLRYRSVSELAESIPDNFRKIIFTGFYAFTNSEKKLCKRLSLRQESLFLFQDGTGIREQISFMGIPSRDGSGEKEGPTVHFCTSPDTHGQVFALSRMLNTLRPEPDEKTVVVLPSSETLFPVLRQCLSSFDEESYNVSMGYPVIRTPVFSFFNNLMELVANMDGDRVYIPDYLKFVLHPYTKNIQYRGRSEPTRILFHALQENLVRSRTITFSTLREVEESVSSLKIYPAGADREEVPYAGMTGHLHTIHEQTIEKFLSFENVKDFAGKCAEVLLYIYRNSTARLHPLFHPFSETFIKVFDGMQRSFMKDITFSELNGYFVFFRKYLTTCHTPFEGVPVHGLQVLGFLETRALQFERVFLLDANEGVLPDTKKEDSLLPLKAREILKIPTYRDRDALVAYYFENLFHGAKECHLFFVENDRKEKSRFAEQLLWENQKKDRERNARKYLNTVQYRVSLGNRDPGEIPKTDGMVEFLRKYVYSATSLDTYLRCQLAFFYAYVLNLKSRDDFSGDIERTDIGEFVHAVLAGFMQNRTGKLLKQNTMTPEDMEIHIGRLFAQRFGKNPSGAAYLLKRQIKKHLRDLITQYYYEIMEQGSLAILGTEVDMHIAKHSFRLRGRIDSIEQRGERTVIVDYKTGSNPSYLKINFRKLDPGMRETWNEAIGSLQLPLYLLLHSEKTGADTDNTDAMFLLLGHALITRNIELPLFDSEEQKKLFPMLEMILFRLLNEIVDPEKPFRPATDKKNICPHCDYRNLCGTQWIVKTRRI